MSVPAVGLVVVALIETAGCGRGLTPTDVDAVTTLPKLSVTVARIVNVPAEENVCETVVAAVIAPRCCRPLPSPQSTVTSLIADPFVAGTATVNVNVAGSPALGTVAGGVMLNVGDEATVTVTLPDAVPLVVGVVGAVGVPVVGGGVVVLEPACAPTAAVTVAVFDVLRVTAAAPFESVVAAD
jgi:hypothetical protein